MRKRTEIKYLLEQYLNQKATEEEYVRLFEALEKEDEATAWEKVIREIIEEQPVEADYNTARWEPVIRKILHQGRQDDKKNHKTRFWFLISGAAAAAVILLLGIGVWLVIQNNKGKHSVKVVASKNDIRPGGNKAVLTLSNGTKILLDSSRNGLLSMQNSTKIVKVNSGLLTYHTDQRSRIKDQRSEVHYNSISTPRGGRYEVVLPDGSKVWLNAASSIRFPTAFAGKDREVRMTGEAYFEIAKNANKPFKVLVGNTVVNVLGTHFNIMAYNDEPVLKTTLLEGAVKVTAGSRQSAVLKPGQQAALSMLKDERKKLTLIKNADINKAVAWKNNLFWFENDNVQEVMKQLARWYAVNIKIKGNIPDLFTGSIPRDLTFSKVFEILQKTGSMHYKIDDDKTVIITP